MVAPLFAIVTTGDCPLLNVQMPRTCALTVELAKSPGTASCANIADAAAASNKVLWLCIFMLYRVGHVEKTPWASAFIEPDIGTHSHIVPTPLSTRIRRPRLD